MFFKVRIFGVFYFLFFIVSFLFANDVNIVASVDSNNVVLGEQFYYYVSINGGSVASPPEIKNIDNVDIYRAGSSTQMSVINGQVSSKVKFTYVLTPREEGKIVIPPVNVKINKRLYSSNSITINVVKNDNQVTNQNTQNNNVQNSNFNSSFVEEKLENNEKTQSKVKNNRDVFITSFIDKKSVYINEPFILTFKVFTKVRFLSSPVFMVGETSGFWKEDLNLDKSYSQIYNGEEYLVLEKKYILYPTIPGELLISPSTLTCNIEEMVDTDNFFGISFFSRGREIKLKTNSIKIKVNDFPAENKPEFFDGNVGNFTIDVKILNDKHKIDEPITLDINIKGDGNINTILPPRLYNIDNYKVYDPLEKIDLQKTDKGFSGTKNFQIMIVPLVSGKQKLPKVKFAFFNYKQKKYIVLEKDLGEIYIENGINRSGDNRTNSLSKEDTKKKAELKLLNGDIRFIHRDTKLIIRNKDREGIFGLYFWVMFLIPIFIYLFIMLLENVHVFCFGKKENFSNSMFNKHLKRIKKSLLKENTGNNYLEIINKILDIFIKYVNYKFSYNSELKNTFETFNNNIDRDSNIPNNIKKDIKDFLDVIYYYKFSSFSISRENVVLIIEKLEKLKHLLDKV